MPRRRGVEDHVVERRGRRAILRGTADSVDPLRRAIALDDTARFEAIPGIGRKTAQRVVMELKEKLASAAFAPEAGQSGELVGQSMHPSVTLWP